MTPFEQCYSCIVCGEQIEAPPGFNFRGLRCRKSVLIAVTDFPAETPASASAADPAPAHPTG